MDNKIATLLAATLGASFSANSYPVNFPVAGRVVSETQKRMHAAWLADAPRRNALAVEIAEWNSKVKRRNQRHVARNLARGRAA